MILDKKKFFVLDAMAIAHRAHWAFKDLKTSDGQHTGMVFGTASFLINLCRSQEPNYFAVAMDSPQATFRKDIYPLYKANRPKKDETFVSQVPLLREFFQVFGAPVLRFPGFEADDIIGTLARNHGKDDTRVFIVSGDKDFMQLVNNNVYMYRPKKWPEFDIVDEMKVYEKFGVGPNQVVDVLAIMGDSADNIPGVYGIGEKGAQKLIKSCGSLEGVYSNLHAAKPTEMKKLNKSRSDAFLSKELVKIKTDMDLPYKDLEEFKFSTKQLKSDKLVEFYKKLEFNSLLKE